MARISKDYIQYFYEHNVDVSTKTIYLGYGQESSDIELDHKLTADVLKGLHLLSHIRSEEPIKIIMNCAGGDVDHGLAIYDAIRECKSPVHIGVLGKAYSMAAWVLQAADYRIISPSSSVMIHDGEGPKDAWTKKQDIYCRQIMLDSIKKKNPKFTVNEIQQLLDRDTFLTAEEALHLGLVDEIGVM